MADFPTLTALPIYPLDEPMGDETIRSPLEAGYKHTRAPFTKSLKTYGIRFKSVSTTDKNLIESHVKGVRQGADSFGWTDPYNLITHTVRYIEVPKFTYIDYNQWDISFVVEVV